MQPKRLFNPRLLQQRLALAEVRKSISEDDRAVVAGWEQRIRTGGLKKFSETQLEQSFLADFFVRLLGYTLVGSAEHFTLVPKRTASSGRDIPDFVLGQFSPREHLERWIVVGELKPIGTDLDAPQRKQYRLESPVQQAFRYAQSTAGTEWIIVSNYDEIRLYRSAYANAYHRWTLADLLKPEGLAEFKFLLHVDRLASTAEPKSTLALFDDSISAGLKVAEGFYALYDEARADLVRWFMSQSSADADLPHLYGKAHKLLNQAVFVAYCEDHPARLVPKHTLRSIYAKAEADGVEGSFWRRFSELFSALNATPVGEQRVYNAFNGGLFAPDEFFEPMSLPNHLFTKWYTHREGRRHTVSMQGIFGFHIFDFGEDLDVDILGAIFEQSLKDLPHLTMNVRGRGEASVTRRQSKGVYYTPRQLTQYLVGRALGLLMEPMKRDAIDAAEARFAETGRAKIGRKLLSAEDTRHLLFLRSVKTQLDQLQILDPACGSGAFLVQSLELLLAEYQGISAGVAQLEGTRPLFGLDRQILRGNLHGVDILEESVEVSKLSLWLRTARLDEPLEGLQSTVVCADALGDVTTPEVPLVVGNPPWGAQLDWSDDEIRRRFPDVGQERDSFAIFVVRAYEMLQQNGILAFVLPNSWITTRGYEPFRRWMLSRFHIVEIVNVWKFFHDVNHDVCLVVLRKLVDGSPTEGLVTHVRSIKRGLKEFLKPQHLAEERWEINFDVGQDTWLKEPNARFEVIYSPALAGHIDHATTGFGRLDEFCDITVGIQAYHHTLVPPSDIKKRVFHSKRREGQDWYPITSGNDVQRYYAVSTNREFLKYSELLRDKRDLAHYAEPRILIQQILWNRLKCTYSEPNEPELYMSSLFSCTNARGGYTLPALCAVLNSRVTSASYERWANRLFGDKFPKVSKIDLARIPIPRLDERQVAILDQLGRSLASNWCLLRAEIATFIETAFLASEELARDLQKFWTMERSVVRTTIARRVQSLEDKQSLLHQWGSANDVVNTLWGTIAHDEATVEKMLRAIWGQSTLHDELLARVRPVSPEDALLPSVIQGPDVDALP